MKISHVSVSILKIPLDRPYLGAGGRTIDGYPVVLARVTTSDGVVGCGYFVALQNQFVTAAATITRELSSCVVGAELAEIEATWARMVRMGRWIGPGGLLHYAMAPLDIAMWDALGKTLGQPLYLLLGGSKNRVEAYASDGFTHDLSQEELAESAKSAAEQGFRALKFRMGPSRTAREEVERFAAIRAAAGRDMRILVEAAESWNVEQALETGLALQEAGAHWIEDPIHHKNLRGLARLVERLNVPIAAGENLFDLDDFARLFEAKAVGIPIIDIGRVGGITPWRRVAALAQGFGLRVCGHVLSEVHVHLLASVPNSYMLEYAPRTSPMLRAMPRLDNGSLVAPEAPGLGIDFDEDAVRRFTQEG